VGSKELVLIQIATLCTSWRSGHIFPVATVTPTEEHNALI